VIDVRVMGAIGVVQFDQPVDRERLKARFLELGVWVRPFGDIVYLTPAFTISAEDCDALTAAVVQAVG
jgi:adenosylmethionine-8-amino-7-oxononanoate aminotransferase